MNTKNIFFHVLIGINLLIISLVFPLTNGECDVEQSVINLSRNSTVEVIVNSRNIKGTGFFISKNYIATCFHVIGFFRQGNNQIKVEIFNDIKVKLLSGEIIKAKCISIPSEKDQTPLAYDFAILELESLPKTEIEPLIFSKDFNKLDVGEKVLFSGYPLNAPAMITHIGIISGASDSKDMICVQASINKGNSGGALLTSKGEILGIVSMREGAISKALVGLQEHIKETSKTTKVRLAGVDNLGAMNEIISVLDNYISTGIGYAINGKHLKAYYNRYFSNQGENSLT